MELHYKVRQFVPKEYRDDELYAKPEEEEMKMTKKEKAMPKDMRTKIGVQKQSLVDKLAEKRSFKTMIEGVAAGRLAANYEVT